MTDAARNDAALAGVTAAALHRGRMFDAWSLALLAGALGGLLWPSRAPDAWRLAGLLACVLAGLAQRVFAARVAFDAAIFDRWNGAIAEAGNAATRDADLLVVDRALAALGLREAPNATPRDLASRSRGALRLLGWQAALLLVQGACLGVGMLVGMP